MKLRGEKMQIVIVIPYRSFWHKVRIIKEYIGTGYITVEENFVMIEQINDIGEKHDRRRVI